MELTAEQVAWMEAEDKKTVAALKVAHRIGLARPDGVTRFDAIRVVATVGGLTKSPVWDDTAGVRRHEEQTGTPLTEKGRAVFEDGTINHAEVGMAEIALGGGRVEEAQFLRRRPGGEYEVLGVWKPRPAAGE